MRNESPHMGWHTDPHQGYFHGDADLRKGAERVEWQRVGANVAHGAEIKVKVADKGAIGIDIRLLPDHDIIDEAGSTSIVSREPRHSGARHVLLESLQQR